MGNEQTEGGEDPSLIRPERVNMSCWCGDSSRACAYYKQKSPHLHCFKCNEQSYDKEIIDEVLELNNTNTKEFIGEVKIRPVTRGIVNGLKNRGITKETAAKYNVEALFNEAQEITGRSYQFKDAEGNIIAAKVKKPDKSMYWEGDASQAGLYGQHLFPAGGRFLTITEGEEDTLAVYQMLKESNPTQEPAVVSIIHGAGSALKDCKKAWEYIHSFDNIIIAFDGDPVGKKAAMDIARLFNYKPKVCSFAEAKKVGDKWQLKDANDYLMADKTQEFVKMWWQSSQIRPKGILTYKDTWEDIIREENTITVKTPWDGLNKLIHGLTTSHVYGIKAPPKIGKTEILKELAFHIQQTTTYNCGILFLENTLKEIGLGLISKLINKPVYPWDMPEDKTELKKAHEELSKDDRFIIFDPESDRSAENIIDKITYFVKANDVKFVFLDHITMLAYFSDNPDERKFLDKLCADLKALATSLDFALIVVSHVNDEGKTRGSRALLQLCDVMINLERDKLSEDPITKNTTHIIVEDNRWGECGKACSLLYDKDTGRMSELDFDSVLDNEINAVEREVEFGKQDDELPF